MKVLVTGGTGHLGRAIVPGLKKREHDVRVLARRRGSANDIEWVEGDLATEPGVGDAVAGVDMIVHAATNSPAARRGGFNIDFAAYVVACVTDGRLGEREDFAGPQTLTMRELVGEYLAARGLERRILNAPLPRGVTSALTAANTSPDTRRGATTWAQWLQRSGTSAGSLAGADGHRAHVDRSGP